MRGKIKSSMIKRSMTIAGHSTSITLEEPFWQELKAIALSRQMSVSKVVAIIDTTREEHNLSSAIRLAILAELKSRCTAAQ
jgi:predicted DNA-binding ribbon-helix-helix protein